MVIIVKISDMCMYKYVCIYIFSHIIFRFESNLLNGRWAIATSTSEEFFFLLFYASAWRFGVDQGQASSFSRVPCVFFQDSQQRSLSFPVSIRSPNFMSATSFSVLLQAQFEWFLRPPLRYFAFLWESINDFVDSGSFPSLSTRQTWSFVKRIVG